MCFEQYTHHGPQLPLCDISINTFNTSFIQKNYAVSEYLLIMYSFQLNSFNFLTNTLLPALPVAKRTLTVRLH